MNKLGINTEYYMDQNIQDTKNHCVLIIPGYDFKLKAGDVVYLIKPGSVTVTKENNSEVARLKSEQKQNLKKKKTWKTEAIS